MPTESYTLTAQDFALYQKEAQRWIDKLGLYCWNVTYRWCDDNVQGRCSWTLSGRKAVVELGRQWPYKPAKDEIRRTAFHEVCELMFAQISTHLNDIYSENFVSGLVHDTIRRLENVFWKSAK